MSSFESQCLAVSHASEQFLLHPLKVMYWPSEHVLFAADVHAGKEHVFSRHGIAIPAGISESTLQRLFSLARESGAKRLIVLGDFMHHVPARGELWLSELSELLDHNPTLSVEIITGNHDKKAGRDRIDTRIIWTEPRIKIGNLTLCHEPQEIPSHYVLCGHLHPAFRVGTRKQAGVRAPAFWFRKHYAVLPAFGEFTGGVIIDPNSSSDSVYMTGSERVVYIPPANYRRTFRKRAGKG